MSSGYTMNTGGNHSQNPQARSANAYLRTMVMSASPQQLRLMLLDGALKFVRQGREGLVNKNFEASFTGFSQGREIIIELMTSLRPDCDPLLAERVRGLYSFLYKHLVEGVHEKDFAKIDEVIRLLDYERETWMLAMEKAVEEQGRSPAGPASTLSPIAA
jgi:flagellar protein FliS